MRDYVVLDVFTETPLQGNPVAVFLDGAGLSTETMQAAARELNLSEIVFLLAGDGDHDAAVRIFTPTAELPFAGHPVLGTAFVVGERTGGESVRLRTGAGPVPVRLRRDGGGIAEGVMEQPLPQPEAVDEAAVLDALGLTGAELPVEGYRNGPLHIYVGLSDIDAVLALRPDMNALAAFGEAGINCFAVGPDHVETRVFCPGLGVPEDPATGSAAGPLALHLARHGRLAFGQELEIHQGTVIGRPSVLRARVEGSAQRLERVLVGGAAVPVAEGRYRLD
jgi:trans-2,3-dihydro-3-hydroxyanthranilate isomerase